MEPIKNYTKGKRLLAARDPNLRALFRRHKVSFSPSLDGNAFKSLVRAVAHQQLHGKAAATILGRLEALYPKKKFPTPKQLLTTSEEKLRTCGFSRSKTKAILDIAAKTLDGTIPSPRKILLLSNEEIIFRLTKIFGVGKWTVEMLLIFQLGRLDVWPVDDFGVRKGFQIWNKKRKAMTAKDLARHRDAFSPYETIVALYLWREADLDKKSSAS